jgi:hypothetical protein
MLAGTVAVGLAIAQPAAPQAPLASSPKVDIQGKIERIQFTRGQGTPSIEVATGGKNVLVELGSMRYLLETNFNPKAGEEVAVTAYKLGDRLIAITVTMSATGKVLRLRDASGRPVWTGGRRGQAAR